MLCVHCQGIRMSTCVKAQSNKYSKKFYELDASKRCAGGRLAQTHKLSLSMMSLAHKDVVLEVGCGGGALLSKINMTESIAVGLDISEMQIKYAKTHLQGVFLLVGDAEQLPLKDNTITKCFAIEILEHVRKPDETMKEIRRVMKDDGELIIVVPNDRNWFIHRILQGYFREAFYDYGHLHNFSSIEKLESLFKGFKILMVRENNEPTMPMRGIISRFFQGFQMTPTRKKVNASPIKKDRESTYPRLLTYEKRFLSIAPKLTLHLIIKLKKTDDAQARRSRQES